MTHTQGKWEIKLADNGEQTGLILGNNGLYHVCDTGVANSYNVLATPNTNTNIELVKQHIEVAKANARLIAAAPDMLAMLKLLIERCDGDLVTQALQAINQGGMQGSLTREAKQLINQIEGK